MAAARSNNGDERCANVWVVDGGYFEVLNKTMMISYDTATE